MEQIDRFFDATMFAVAGASKQRDKYGNKVFRALLAAGYLTYPLNPKEGFIEGHQAFVINCKLPVVPEPVSIITRPTVTAQIVEDAITCGVKQIWMQPGAENEDAAKSTRHAGLNVIDNGSCILVWLALR